MATSTPSAIAPFWTQASAALAMRVASLNRVSVRRNDDEHAALHAALANLFQPFLDATDFGRLTGEIDDNLADAAWVEKLPTPAFAPIASEFVGIVDQHVGPIEDRSAGGL